jgi:hypothetical protein
MARQCKHVEENQKSGKCHDFYISHSKGGIVMCRLAEWKKKRGTCPYDRSIKSFPGNIRRRITDKCQRKLI